MTNPDRHEMLLTVPQLAARLRVSVFTLQRRTDLPRPIRVSGRKLYVLAEVQHLFPPPTYHEQISAAELACLLHCSINSVYRLVHDGVLPHATRQHGRATWSRRDVEAHLRALPR